MFSGKDAKLVIKYIMCCHYWLFCLWSGNHSLLIPKLSLNKCICYYTDGPHFCISCWEVSFMLQIMLGYKQANLKVFFFSQTHPNKFYDAITHKICPPTYLHASYDKIQKTKSSLNSQDITTLIKHTSKYFHLLCQRFSYFVSTKPQGFLSIFFPHLNKTKQKQEKVQNFFKKSHQILSFHI